MFGALESEQGEDRRGEVGKLPFLQGKARSSQDQGHEIRRVRRVRAHAVVLQELLGVPMVGGHEADSAQPADGLHHAPEAAVDRLHRLDDVPALEVLDAPFERLEAIDAVWRAVENLNVDLKSALLLRDVVGLSYTEIADALEITLATVKWRIYKAREDVQLALAREGIYFYAAVEAEPAVQPAPAL